MKPSNAVCRVCFYLIAIGSMTSVAVRTIAVEPIRTWRDSAGRAVAAKFIATTKDSVQLAKEDGKIIDVPIARLSLEDQEYLKSLNKTRDRKTTQNQHGSAKIDPPTKEDAQQVAARLQQLANAMPESPSLKSVLPGHLWRIYSAVGDEQAAMAARNKQMREPTSILLLEILRGQLRAGQTNTAKETARRIHAKLETAPDDGKGRKPVEVVNCAAQASALLRDHDGVERALARRMPDDDHSNLRLVIVSLQSRIGDIEGAYATAKGCSPAQRLKALALIVNSQPIAPDTIPAEFYSRLLKELSAEPKKETLPLTIELLAGVCRHGRFDDAASFVIGIPPTNSQRQSLLCGVLSLQAEKGLADKAITNALRGGYLATAAQLQIDASRLEDGAKNLEKLLASLKPVSPPRHAAEQLDPVQVETIIQMEGSPVRDRVRLLRWIAFLQFTARRAKEGKRTIDLARQVAKGAYGTEQPVLKIELDSTELEATATTVAPERIDHAIGIAQAYSSPKGVEESLSHLWSTIGSAQWKAGRQSDARKSFQRAIDAVSGYARGPISFVGEIAAARAKAGDLSGAVETLELERREVTDQALGCIAIAQARNGEVAAALATLNRVRPFTQRHAELLAGVAETQAEKDGFEAAFRTYYNNMRSIGESNLPVNLILKAIAKGQTDVVLRNLKPVSEQQLMTLVKALNEKRQNAATQRILERMVEIELAAGPRRLNSQIYSIFELMAKEGDASRIEALLPRPDNAVVPPTQLAQIYARFGKIDDVVTLAKRADRPQNATRLLLAAMESATRRIVSPEQLHQDGFVTVAPPFRAPDKFSKAFSGELGSAGSGSEQRLAVVEPHVAADGTQSVVSTGSMPAQPVETAPLGEHWSVSTIRDGFAAHSARQLAVATTEGQPFIFTMEDGPNGSSVIAIRAEGKAWKSNAIATPPAGTSYIALDAHTMGTSVLLALRASVERDSSLEIRTYSKGVWQTEYTTRRRGPYGDHLVLGAVEDKQFIVSLDGDRSDSEKAGRHLQCLERTPQGAWKETTVPLPETWHLRGISATVFRNELVLAAYDRNAIFVGSRRDGVWSFTPCMPTVFFGVHLIPGRDGVVLAARGDGLSFWTLEKNQWQYQRLDLHVPLEAKIMSSHVATIGGKPTLAFFESKSSTVHLLSLDSGKWSEQIIKTAVPIKELVAMRLFEWNKHPAIVAITGAQGDSSLILLRPSGLN
ncbi:MAG: hypothetical protein K8T91_19045 [Planctomycetes bacterium]|nr:hypothetical protein [Planctomycetota bacterium]